MSHNLKHFQEKLYRYPELSPDEIDPLFTFLQSAPEEALYRINPLTFARDHNLNPDRVVTLFVIAARIALFDLSWNLLCPTCGAVLDSYNTIDQLDHIDHFCAICNINVPVLLDDFIEVSFTINNTINPLHFTGEITLKNHRQICFSKNFESSPELTEYVRRAVRELIILKPGEEQEIDLTVSPESHHRIISINSNRVHHLYADNSVTEPLHTIPLTDGQFDRDQRQITPGRNRLMLQNDGDHPLILLLVETWIDEITKIMRHHPPHFKPFLTGKHLLNTQIFRDLFDIDALNPDLKINIRSLTLLFTDLKSSTEMYEEIGDIAAYDLIQQHFSVLFKIIQKYQGAVVKTMGDAVMASFNTPLAGINCAMEMLEKIPAICHPDGTPLGLKVGLHEGHALLINADQHLDYFGQTVNTAARIQGLAGGGECWISDRMFNHPGVKEELQNRFQLQRKYVTLKGISGETTVWKLSR